MPTKVSGLKVRYTGDYAPPPGTNAGTVTRTSATPVELYTDQVHIRSRGRSFALRIESENKGVKWKLGSPRIDIRPDGRR